MCRVFFAGLVLSSVMANIVNGQESYPVAEPSAEHKVLKYDAGVWDAAITLFIPGQEPMESKGIETNKMLGEFWVVSDFEYEAMGAKFTGHGSFGFDPQSKKYVGSWHGSESPYVSHLIGDYDTETKTFTYKMTGKDPAGNPSNGKIVDTHTDANHRHFEMHMEMGGEMVKWMEIEYTRRK